MTGFCDAALQSLLSCKYRYSSSTVQAFPTLPAAKQFKLPHQPYNYLEEVNGDSCLAEHPAA